MWSENFDNLAIGSVGSDLTGKTAGKGGWYTLGQGHGLISNLDFSIVAENGRGNVLIIQSSLKKGYDPLYAERKIWKHGINNIWKLRDSLNNILKYEYSFFIERKSTNKDKIFEEISNAKDGCLISQKNINGYTNEVSAAGIAGKLNLPINKWSKAIVYLDYYSGGDLYHEYPDINYIAKSSISIGVIEAHTLDLISFKIRGYDNSEDYYRIRFDNLTISAVNTLPKLNTNEYLSDKFNLFPNPAVNMVNVNNKENMQVQQIAIYDISGKQLSTQIFSNQTEIQLNVENLASGTYMLHIQTNAGLVVKKLVKK